MKMHFSGRHKARKEKWSIPHYKSEQDKLNQEIHNLEALHQQVEKRKEKMLRVSQLQK
jgi:hypothetical protein